MNLLAGVCVVLAGSCGGGAGGEGIVGCGVWGAGQGRQEPSCCLKTFFPCHPFPGSSALPILCTSLEMTKCPLVNCTTDCLELKVLIYMTIALTAQ